MKIQNTKTKTELMAYRKDYLEKLVSLLQTYWSDRQHGRLINFSHYKEKAGVTNPRLTKGLVDGLTAGREPGYDEALALAKSVAPKDAAEPKIVPNGAKTDGPLSEFSARELIAELQRRGYRGKLSFTHEISL